MMRSGSSLGAAALSVIAICILLAASFALTGCKDTDFFKRIVHVASEAAPDPELVRRYNSPDAQVEAPDLPAWDLQKDAELTDEVDYVVVYGPKPTTDLPTRHSIFDLDAQFHGIAPSDGVRLIASTDKNALDEEVQTEDKPQAKTESKTQSKSSKKKSKTQGNSGKKKSKSSKKSAAASKKSKSKAKSKSNGKKSTGDAGGSSPNGRGNDSGENEDEGSGDSGAGTSARESGGYGGDEITYDPGNALEEVQKADHVAAIGQAAVIVQAIGGKGALVAMDAYTYEGKVSNGEKATYASSFADVFGDELASGFDKEALLWSGDGSTPDCLTPSKKKDRTQALVKAVAGKDGKGGDIFFCGDKGSQKDYFSSEQLTAFKKAGIQLVPIDLTSAQGILDAVSAVGDALEESGCEQDAAANAKEYKKTFKRIVDAVVKTTRDNSPSSSGKLYNPYDGMKSASANYDVYGVVATDFEDGVAFKHSRYSIDSTGGVLFTDAGYKNSPLSLFMQAAGVTSTSAARYSKDDGFDDTLVPLWGNFISFNKNNFSGYSSDGPFARWAREGNDKFNYSDLLKGKHYGGSDAVWDTNDGLGSKTMPYLVVSSTSRQTAAEIKEAVVESGTEKDTPYYSYKWQGLGGAFATLQEEQADADGEDVTIRGIIGGQNDYYGNLFKDKGVSYADCVRENPVGLVGEWAHGSLESVLESAWLADLYSKAPENCDYEPVTDMSKFSVEIGGETCTTLKQAVDAFYETFYRCPGSQKTGDKKVYVYDEVVTDTGEGLE